MKAIEILMEEHQVILHVLDAAEKYTSTVKSGNARPGFFLDLADFISNFADKCHHAKEEGVLFKEMEAGGVAVQGGPIGVMLADHEQARLFTRRMKQAAEKWQAGDVSAIPDVVTNGQGYINLLRMHIQKEDNILYPMAEKVIPPEKQAAMEVEFERIEQEETGEGVHHKYEALAEKLEQEANQ